MVTKEIDSVFGKSTGNIIYRVKLALECVLDRQRIFSSFLLHFEKSLSYFFRTQQWGFLVLSWCFPRLFMRPQVFQNQVRRLNIFGTKYRILVPKAQLDCRYSTSSWKRMREKEPIYLDFGPRVLNRAIVSQILWIDLKCRWWVNII